MMGSGTCSSPGGRPACEWCGGGAGDRSAVASCSRTVGTTDGAPAYTRVSRATSATLCSCSSSRSRRQTFLDR